MDVRKKQGKIERAVKENRGRRGRQREDIDSGASVKHKSEILNRASSVPRVNPHVVDDVDELLAQQNLVRREIEKAKLKNLQQELKSLSSDGGFS